MRMLLGLVAWISLSAHAASGPLCFENTCLQVLEAKAGRAFLSQPDGFFRALTPYDRSMRLKVDREVSAEEFARFAGEQALSWTAQDRKQLQGAVAWLRKALAEKKVAYGFLPRRVRVIKTTGLEEGQAPYTRGAAIILPAGLFKKPELLGAVLAHELVHILLRSVYPERRDAAYALAGYRPLLGFVLPEDAGPRLLTNPDGFGYSHAATLADGTRVVPVLTGTGPYDPARGGEFFSYLKFRLLEVEDHQGIPRAKRDVSGALVWRDPGRAYLDAVRSATDYVIHPDELIASNFEALLSGREAPPGTLPKLLAKHLARR
ncbi:MAG: hypothetical protein M3Y59_12805 [Myxococcota bacterium]|nr:hypothetical protein [Myxococcota bacterium]